MNIDRIRSTGVSIVEAINAPLQKQIDNWRRSEDDLRARIAMASKSADVVLDDYAHGRVDYDAVRHDRQRRIDLDQELKDSITAREILERKLTTSPPVLRIDMLAVAIRNALTHAGTMALERKELHPDEVVTFSANLAKLQADLEQYATKLHQMGATDKQIKQLAEVSGTFIKSLLDHPGLANINERRAA